MTIRRLLKLLALLASPATLAAQDAERQIEIALQRALDAGVPVALLESKVAEGRAKGVPLERIAAAVTRRLEQLQLVQSQLRNAQLGEVELGLAADAVQAGVSTAVLQRLAETAPRERRAAAMAALSQLVQLGYPPGEALQHVAQALRGGPADLMNLPAQAAAARARAPNADRGGGPPPGKGPGAAASRGRGGPPATVPAGGKGKKNPKDRGRPDGD